VSGPSKVDRVVPRVAANRKQTCVGRVSRVGRCQRRFTESFRSVANGLTIHRDEHVRLRHGCGGSAWGDGAGVHRRAAPSAGPMLAHRR
jgi:hypothetical protein